MENEMNVYDFFISFFYIYGKSIPVRCSANIPKTQNSESGEMARFSVSGSFQVEKQNYSFYGFYMSF